MRTVCLLICVGAIACDADVANDGDPDPAGETVENHPRHHPDFLVKLSDPAGYRGPSMRRSQCGLTLDFRYVNRYYGTSLGVATRFVWKEEHAVAMLAQPDGTPICSGTTVGEGLFLTASHCVGADIGDKAIVLNAEQPFRDGDPWLVIRQHGITKVEDGASVGIDYALLEVPGLQARRVLAADPPVGSQITIIQNSSDWKTYMVGTIARYAGEFITYSDLDTTNGTDGAGILDANGFLAGIHTGDGCRKDGGENVGMRIEAILAVSPRLSVIAMGPQPDPSAGSVHVGVSDGAKFLDRGFRVDSNTCIGGAGTCAIGDVDGDGIADLVHFEQDAAGNALVSLAKPSSSAGSQFAAPRRTRRDVCLPNRTCRLGDVDGDGRADAIEFSNDGAADVTVSLSQGSTFGPRAIWQERFCTAGQVCAVGDVDGDGRADAVAFTRGPDNDILVAESMGTYFAASIVAHTSFCPGMSECRLGDVDGDGRADAVAFEHGEWKLVRVAPSMGLTFGAATIWRNTFCDPGSSCDVADVTGDGKADAVEFVQADDGDVLVAPSTGTSFGVAPAWHPAQCFSGHTCLVGDVTGDGKADAVTLQRGG